MAEPKKKKKKPGEKIKFHWESGANDEKENNYIMEVAEWNQVI